jgi:glycosyltransferase involved in cell wall biosynthesis
MKILQVIDSLGLGGAEVLVTNLYAGFSERGIDCEYYLLHSEKTPLEQSLAGRGAHIYAPLTASVYSPLHIRALSQHLGAFDYDVIHVHLFPAQLWAACGIRLARIAIPLVTTEHNTENRRRSPWCRGSDRWMYRQYRRIASISPAATANLVSWLPELGDKIAECPNGIDVYAFASAHTSGKQALFSVSEDTAVILCVGRLELVKDHETLLRAVSLVPGAVLALAGDGQLSEKLHTLANQLGIASRVRFLGKRMDIPQLLKAADVYVQPSRVEGFGIAALEAMAAGKPVIASDIPGLGQVIGDAGLLFAAGDARQLAACITTLLGDADMRQRLATSAQRRARMFSLDRTLDCYENLYRDVVGKVAPASSNGTLAWQDAFKKTRDSVTENNAVRRTVDE